MRECAVLRFALLVAFLLPGHLWASSWLVPPTALNLFDQLPGADGILGTQDDVLIINSSYTGGSYVGPAGATLSANVSLMSEAVGIGGNSWKYTWEITNSGTGPFVSYVDTGRGPNFLQDPPLFGTAGPDRIPGTPDDVAPETEIDMRVGGPPIIGLWGGAWNPEVETLEAMRFEPIPEPSNALFVVTGLGLVAVWRWRRIRSG